MARKPRRRRGGTSSRGGGGVMTSLRGGFRSVARGVTGTGAPARRQSPARRVLGTVITVALLAAAAALLFRRFGAGH